MNGVEFHGKVSFLKTGIVFASEISTVSGTYAEEITKAELGCGLDGLLKMRAEEGRLTGIINGIDDSWDPSLGDRIASPFDARDLSGKEKNAERSARPLGSQFRAARSLPSCRCWYIKKAWI